MSQVPQMQERTVELIVASREVLADDVVGLVLEDPNGAELPDWNPGAHIDLLLTDTLVRQYSLCSSPSDLRQWKVGVLLDRNGRGGSKHVHQVLEEGASVQVRGPRNHFPLQRAPRYQFIAGGIGITPIMPMIEVAEADGADWHLLYGGRQRSSMAFLKELSQYDDRVTIWPQDQDGILDLASVLATPREDTLVYCCGPEPLLNAVEKACESGHELHCTSNVSLPSLPTKRRRRTRSMSSRWSASGPASPSRSARATRSSTRCGPMASACWRRAWRVSAARARRRCSKEHPITAIRC